MPLVATLISDPKRAQLAPSLAHKAMRAVDASDVDWLGEAIACDIAIPPGIGRREASTRLHAALDGAPVDVAVQEADARVRMLLVADMDSTMIEQECIDELADEIGIKSRVSAITARAMNGEIAFEPALRERVALLEGLQLEVIERVIAERITLAPGGPALVATMNRAGALTVLVSGGFDIFTERVSGMLGFARHQANRLGQSGNRLSGTVEEPILGRSAKAEALRTIAAERGLTPNDALAVGDGANDLDMIAIAGTGVALHAKPAVAQAAPFRIDHGDLTALLYLQGYRLSDFAA